MQNSVTSYNPLVALKKEWKYTLWQLRDFGINVYSTTLVFPLSHFTLCKMMIRALVLDMSHSRLLLFNNVTWNKLGI